MIELRKRVDKFGIVIKNVRIADAAIEFDLFANDQDSKDDALRVLSLEYGSVLGERDLTNEGTSFQERRQNKEEIVNVSIQLFNEERYWECHETLEEIWRVEKDRNEKELQQGVIIAASALVHAQKNENTVCLGMIPRALAKLNQWDQPKYYSLDVETLKKRMEEILTTKTITFPKI